MQIDKFKILKSFLNYKHLTTETDEKIKRKLEKGWRIKYDQIEEGWLTSTIINQKFNKFLGTYQSQYLSDRLKIFFEEKGIPRKNKRPIKLYRLAKNPKAFKQLFKEFYKKNEIWNFILSDYFGDCYPGIPLFRERAMVFFISKFKEVRRVSKKRDKEGCHTYTLPAPHILDGVYIPPSMLYYIISNGSNPIYRLLDDLTELEEKAKGFSHWESPFLKLELSFWLQDYLRAPTKPIEVSYEGGKKEFEPKKFILNIIHELEEAQKQVQKFKKKKTRRSE